ncbi:MAG: phosphoadenylyl-sulfate reductase [Candidatus Omnitrophica bacterium]|nr:phosphoadenylyl-sulfate reductase [Candidatus Omnitrophota bacterium]
MKAKEAAKSTDFETQSAESVLKWALGTYHPKIALASSFGVEDVLLIDMMVKINPAARVFSLDTGRLNQETYDCMDKVREKYGVRIEVYYPNTEAAENMVRERGLNLFYHSIENRKECCGVRKVEPLNRALKGLDAWITGLRRAQAVTRTDIKKVETDAAHGGILKINPIADWTTAQVWDYVKRNKVPYNALHDKGYPSIGCEPCTRAVKPGEDERAGRWWWELPEQKECGLHVKKATGRD